jgi:glycine/D-amino acid oxidase-like deaminating enzyme
LLATRRYCAGLLDPAAATSCPLNYTLGLAQAAVPPARIHKAHR